MVPPLTPSVAWDISIDRKSGNKIPMKPGRYWFSMTQRQQQTGWATPDQVAQDIPYNPFSDSHAVGAKVAPNPIMFVGLPPELYKESFMSNVIEIDAKHPWNMARVKVGKDHQMQPDYYMTTPEAQHGVPFPIAPQIYHAFYVSSDSGLTWRLYDTHKSSLAAPYQFSSNFATNGYANPNTLNQAMGNFADDVKITATKVFSKPPPSPPSTLVLTKPSKPTTVPTTYALIGINILLVLWVLYCVSRRL